MRTMGLIGGMSWESTVSYYKIVNTVVKERLGGLHSARCILYSVDFHEFEEYLREENWDRISDMLSEAGQRLERAGADFVVICTNTMHNAARQVEQRLSIPLLHIADATADVILARGMRRVGLLGTAYTMEKDFYTGRLGERGLEALVPEAAERAELNRIIFEELCLGTVLPASRAKLLAAINALAAQGAEGIILGCTELGMLVTQEETAVPLFDTADIHARSAAFLALGLDK